jgi:Fic family protein
MPDYIWKPIEPLGDVEKRIDLAAMRPLYENWRASRKRIQQSSQVQLADFNQRLIRRLSVETGILERLYDLDRGTTEALVAHGFAEELVTRSNTNIEPSRLIDLLRDQEAAIQLVIDCVAKSRELTKGLIHELHAILTRHQETTTAVDQFGYRLEIPLVKGKYKEQPNNPRRPDGTTHEYCPPLHVESEMDRLLQWLADYCDDDPVIVAAWVHHRFTQIHPYQDGNGRVSRALTTMILLRSGLLPLVIDRDLRVEYLDALESGDLGSLAPLANMFARLERNAILQALSVDADADISHQQSLTSAVISSLQAKFGKRRIQKLAELRQANEVALELRAMAESSLRDSFEQIESTVADVGKTEAFVQPGGSDRGNGHWYKFEVASSAREAGKFANFSENHYFLKASIRAARERLVFVISFHHVGRDLTGIMEATAFSRLESYEDSDDRESVNESFSVCSVEPFVFTHQTEASKIVDAFSRWLDVSLAVALKEYGDRL